MVNIPIKGDAGSLVAALGQAGSAADEAAEKLEKMAAAAKAAGQTTEQFSSRLERGHADAVLAMRKVEDGWRKGASAAQLAAAAAAQNARVHQEAHGGIEKSLGSLNKVFESFAAGNVLGAASGLQKFVETAIGGNTPLGKFVVRGGEVVGALGALSIHAGKAAAETLHHAEAVNISAENYEKWSFITNQTGASMTGFERALRQIETAQEKAAQSGQRSSGAFAKYGIELVDAMGKARDPLKVFEEVLGKAARSTNSTGVLFQLLGKRIGGDFAEAAHLGAAGLQKLEERRQALHLETSLSKLEDGRRLYRDFQELGKVTESVNQKVGLAFAPGFDRIITAISDAMGKATPGIEKAADSLGEGFEKGAAQAISAIERIGSAVKNLDNLVSGDFSSNIASAFKFLSGGETGRKTGDFSLGLTGSTGFGELVEAPATFLRNLMKKHGPESLKKFIEQNEASLEATRPPAGEAAPLGLEGLGRPPQTIKVIRGGVVSEQVVQQPGEQPTDLTTKPGEVRIIGGGQASTPAEQAQRAKLAQQQDFARAHHDLAYAAADQSVRDAEQAAAVSSEQSRVSGATSVENAQIAGQVGVENAQDQLNNAKGKKAQRAAELRLRAAERAAHAQEAQAENNARAQNYNTDIAGGAAIDRAYGGAGLARARADTQFAQELAQLQQAVVSQGGAGIINTGVARSPAEAQAKLATNTDTTANVMGRLAAGADEAAGSLQSLASASENTGEGVGGGGEGGDIAVGATGGLVFGPGTSTSDSVLARLSRGEYVMNARAVSHWGSGFMHALNAGRLPGFAKGGIVPGGGSSGPHNVLNLHIDGHRFGGLRASDSTFNSLRKFSVSQQTRSAGRAPNWVR